MSIDNPRRDDREVAGEVASDGVKRGRDGRVMNPASLANLVPGAGGGREGQAPALRHGERTHSPQRSPEWSPAVQLALGDLAARVGVELRDPATGDLHPWAVPSVEAVAVLRVALARVERWVADRESRGTYHGEDDERVAKIADRYHSALAREALTLRSRLEAAHSAQSLDLSRVLSIADPAEREASLRAAGLLDETVEGEASDA